ncbi:regulator of G-protein signaling 22-like isoform X5 [Ostrea edulis]|uniref:regulator of G-protein signaling 22-like isoform X5 n=1 Tax=Ostrea edulis TaxID=37623 RepID=UPI0024AFF592|nr:regulator of G-protein signaling 22-like isoform X5 [Ostrea edulis]
MSKGKRRGRKKDPEDVEYEDVEDFLATDDLFVDYFNAYLSLPTFPAPLCFNKDTGGFEVVTDAKKELAKQIKAAIRSQRRTPKIYNVVKQHSFSNIPLIPIEEPDEPENLEINTSFTVTTLNKEQGIHWIKEERLPAFLESEYYMEYRLGRLISQTKVQGDKGQFVLMSVDYKPKTKIRRKKSVEEVPQIDPKEKMAKDMFVCMGDTPTTEANAWFTSAQITQTSETTFSTLARPKSAEIVRRPNSARPASAYSALEGYHRSESGVGTSIRSSVYSGHHSKTSLDNLDDVYSSKLFAVDGKPMIHKPSESVFSVTEDYSSKQLRPFSSTIYTSPKIDPIEVDDESGFEATDSESNSSRERQDDFVDDEPPVPQELEAASSPEDSQKGIVFKNIDDIGAAVVRAVLTKSIAQLSNRDEMEVMKDPDVAKKLPETQHRDLTVDMLDRVTLEEKKEEAEVKEEEEEEEEEDIEREEEESDNDSLLDSEEDYEESDTFFRKHKHKTYSLNNRKGIEQFKTFLEGTAGEKNWRLWIDIDRLVWMNKQDKVDPHVKNIQMQQFLSYIREQYHKQGAPYELSYEQKQELGLVEPSSWNLEKLGNIQNKIAEPLVLYWAPRFLLKQVQYKKTEENYLYQNLKQVKAQEHSVNPSPHTASLLPLRPKSCVPRIQQTVSLQPPAVRPPTLLETSPPVGMKRVYAPSALRPQSSNFKTRQEERRKKMLSSQFSVDKSIKPRIKSAPSRTSSGGSVRPSSARPSSSVKTPIGSEMPDSDVRSRPSSAGSDRESVSSSISSVFPGGKRMDALLNALYHERQAGGFFQKYIERSSNKMWVNCLSFWTDVQEYHMLFYAEVIDPYIVQKKAKVIYSRYIVVGGNRNIGCSHEIRGGIYRALQPPFEELFDEAEEYSLSILYVAWTQMINVDMKTYGKVELIEVKKHLETRSKYVLNLQRKGFIKQRVLTPEDPMEGYEDPVYDETLLEKIPEEFRDFTLEKLVHNRIEVENFKLFLAENYASMDLLCWMDIEHFRRMPQTDEKRRDEKAKEIKTKYLNKKYFFGPNSPAGKEGQDKVMAAGGGYGKLLDDRPPNPVILEAQKYVRDRLEKKWLPLFLATSEFAERQKPKAGMDDVVDDVLVQKKKKSQSVMRLLDTKWQSSAKDIILFRKCLLNPVTALQFRRFVSVKDISNKEDKLENDVLFWLEVQRFKDLYHVHCDDSVILAKVNSIIGCFIESTIPPSLQIDIPADLAERIAERKYERSPYIFREAQLIVFRYLYQHWNDFINFRSNLADEKVLPTIERRRRYAKVKERQKLREIEEKALKSGVSNSLVPSKPSPKSSPLIPGIPIRGWHSTGPSTHKHQRIEAERRAAEGLPPLGDEDEDDQFHDPFAMHRAPSQEDEEEAGHGDTKDKISWSYSSYMAALHKEDILNNTDESTFSSLMSDSGSVHGSESAEKESNAVTVPSSSTIPKREMKTEQTQTDKRKPGRVGFAEEPAKPEAPIKGALKKRGKESQTSSKGSVGFSKMTPLEEEGEEEPIKSQHKRVKVKTEPMMAVKE